MKKVKLIVLAVIICVFPVLVFSLYHQIYGYGAEKDGFLGIKWGTKLDQMPGRQNSLENGIIMFYHDSTSNRRLCGASIKKITYGFYHNKFDYVRFEFVSSAARVVLINNYTKTYGYEPKVTTKVDSEGVFIEATWFKNTNAWTMIKYNTISEEGVFYMLYAPVMIEEIEKENSSSKKDSKIEL
jgi:hypothetical protein